MKALLTKFRKSESGATAIEYGLIAALIAVTLIFSLTAIGNSLSTKFGTIATKVGSQNR